MLLSENLLQPLIVAHEQRPLICGQLFKFLENDQKFVIIKKRGAREGFRIRWILFFFIAFSFVIRIIMLKNPNFNLNSPVDADLDQNMSILMIATSMVVLEPYRVRCSSPEDFVLFLNGAFGIEKKYINCTRAKTSTKLKLAKLALKATQLISNYVFSIGMSITCGVMNTFPFNPMWALDFALGLLDNETTYFNILRKSVAALANYIIWAMISLRGYAMVVDILIGVLSITYCEDQSHRKIYGEFPHRKLFTANEKERDDDVTISCELVVLREVYLLSEMYNDAMRSFFCLFLIGSGVIEINSTVALIRPQPLAFLVSFLFVMITVQTAIIILVVYGFAGDVYQNSKSSLGNLKQKVQFIPSGSLRKEKRFVRRFIASCQPIRIRFGLSNFIEKSTPPLYQLFCVDRIIDILLVT